MSTSPRSLWANALLSEFIEGCADAFLITSGGAAIAQTGAVALPTLTPLQLLYSIGLGGLWYVASYLKKNPLPASAALAAPVAGSEQRVVSISDPQPSTPTSP